MISSESTDNYLKAVYEITAVQERAGTNEIARRLKISAASVTGMLKKLASSTPSLITYEKRRGAELTREGQERAIEVIRHHRLIESYLHHALDYGWDEVHEEAEKLEHFISEDLEDRMAAKLGFPEYDPHGHPIPRRDGTIPPCDDLPLRQIAAGSFVRVSRVSDEDSALLRAIARSGIGLHTTLEVVEQREGGGETRLRKSGGTTFALDAEITSRMRVTLIRTKGSETDGAALRSENGGCAAVESSEVVG